MKPRVAEGPLARPPNRPSARPPVRPTARPPDRPTARPPSEPLAPCAGEGYHLNIRSKGRRVCVLLCLQVYRIHRCSDRIWYGWANAMSKKCCPFNLIPSKQKLKQRFQNFRIKFANQVTNSTAKLRGCSSDLWRRRWRRRCRRWLPQAAVATAETGGCRAAVSQHLGRST